jgi:hypothetical protein
MLVSDSGMHAWTAYFSGDDWPVADRTIDLLLVSYAVLIKRPEGFEDLFGGFGPHERLWVLVPGDDPGADIAFEGVHAATVVALEEWAGEFGEPAFDLVDPTGIGWGAGDVEPGVFVQPVGTVGAL